MHGLLYLVGLVLAKALSSRSNCDLPLPPPPPPPEENVDAVEADCLDRADSSKFNQSEDAVVFVICPPGCSISGASLFGTDNYTSDSGVCKSAIHAGVLTDAGGSVMFHRFGGLPNYVGSQRNDVVSSDWGAWSSSFSFIAVDNIVPPPPETDECEWSSCSEECGGGVQMRPCGCDYPFCYDRNTTQECNTQACPDHHCDWSACSVECGGGVQTRPCDCDGLVASECEGNSTMDCNTHECQDVCIWSPCSVECGGGNRTRPCECDDQSGSCVGNSTDVCNINPCVDHADEGCEWSLCSAECGGGIQTRPCHCKGNTTQDCNTHPCCDTCTRSCGLLNPPNVTHPTTNITVPTFNQTVPVFNVTLPDLNTTVPNFTVPIVNFTMPDLNVTIPTVNVTIPDTNFTRPNTTGCARCPTLWSAAFLAGAVKLSAPIVLDMSVVVPSITVMSGAALIFANKDLTLQTNWIHVQAGGSLIIGTAECPYTARANITLLGANTTRDDIGGAMGTKGIAFDQGSYLSLYGVAPLPTWTHLAETAEAGAMNITLMAAVNWRVGQTIIIASTGFDQNQTEERTIVGLSDDGTILMLDAPLAWTHWGEGFEQAEVAVLNRNIVIQGDWQSDDVKFGGHFMMKGPVRATIHAVEFTRLGQHGRLGRYPLHFHMEKDISSYENVISDNSIHHNYQRCIVVHDTRGLIIRDNVAYDTEGHCYFLEDGSEMNNVLTHNLGVYVREGKLLPSDSFPAVYWITNANNTFIENTAVGGHYGYWFALPEHPTGASAPDWATSTTMWPRQIPVQVFENNIAHSASQKCLFIDKGPSASGVPESSVDLIGRTPPYSDEPRSDYIVSNFSGLILYKCRDQSIWTRGWGHHFSNCTLADFAIGVQMIGADLVIEDSSYIQETENVETIQKGATEASQADSDDDDPVNLIHLPVLSRGVANSNLLFCFLTTVLLISLYM